MILRMKMTGLRPLPKVHQVSVHFAFRNFPLSAVEHSSAYQYRNGLTSVRMEDMLLRPDPCVDAHYFRQVHNTFRSVTSFYIISGVGGAPSRKRHLSSRFWYLSRTV